MLTPVTGVHTVGVVGFCLQFQQQIALIVVQQRRLNMIHSIVQGKKIRLNHEFQPFVELSSCQFLVVIQRRVV